jgi:hypothetical protein
MLLLPDRSFYSACVTFTSVLTPTPPGRLSALVVLLRNQNKRSGARCRTPEGEITRSHHFELVD